MTKSGLIALTSIYARERRLPPDAPEGAAASGKALGEVALLSPDEALQRLSSTAGGLTPNQVKQQLRSVGRNEVAHQAGLPPEKWSSLKYGLWPAAAIAKLPRYNVSQ